MATAIAETPSRLRGSYSRFNPDLSGPFSWRKRTGVMPTFGGKIVAGELGEFKVIDGKVNGIDVHNLTRENLKVK